MANTNATECATVLSTYIDIKKFDPHVTESGPNARLLQNQYSQVLIKRKVAFNQNASNLGRWWTQRPPKKHLQTFCSAMKAFNGKTGK